jgi:hypothetical protein
VLITYFFFHRLRKSYDSSKKIVDLRPASATSQPAAGSPENTESQVNRNGVASKEVAKEAVQLTPEQLKAAPWMRPAHTCMECKSMFHSVHAIEYEFLILLRHLQAGSISSGSRGCNLGLRRMANACRKFSSLHPSSLSAGHVVITRSWSLSSRETAGLQSHICAKALLGPAHVKSTRSELNPLRLMSRVLC